jgi:type IV pilus assembly protein PilC
VAAIVAFCIICAATKKGRSFAGKLFRSMGAFRTISENIARARFASGMSLALSSGLDIDRGLTLVAALSDHPVLSPKITQCQQLIMEGTDFAKAVSDTGIFSGVYARMLSVGFKTGSTDEVMEKIARQYETEIETKIQNTIAVIEPTLVAVLSIIVGIILLSVMLPLAGIMANLGTF